MVKKRTSSTKSKNSNLKQTKPRKKTKSSPHNKKSGIDIEKALVDNFIGLQKVMVNLSGKFDNLSNEISRLLNIFEVSAKAMAKKEFEREKDPELKKILDKLDNLSKQAGLIGKGLALIHESGKESTEDRFTLQPSIMAKKSFKPDTEKIHGKNFSQQPNFAQRKNLNQIQPSQKTQEQSQSNTGNTQNQKNQEKHKSQNQNYP